MNAGFNYQSPSQTGGSMTGETLSEHGVSEQATPTGRAAAWALASLWIGSFVFLAAPIMEIFLALAWQLGPKRPIRLDQPDELAFSLLSVFSTIAMLV
jgi:hypothetical protein